MPLVRSKDRQFALFEGMNVDEACDMLVLLPPGGWLTEVVPWVYSVVTIVLIIRGIAHALFHTAAVNYLPHNLRIGKKRRWLRFVLPFMELITKVSDQDRSIVTFKGILDAVVNLRATCVAYQIATTLLTFKFTLGNMVYMCGALIKITWFLCLVQTFMRMTIKLGARCLRSVRLIRSMTREKIEWNADGISILFSFHIYFVMLFVLTFILIEAKGDPSFMVRDVPYKTAAYGGVEDIAGFWGSEVACDLVTLLGLVAVISQLIGVALMYTKFKYVADNSLMRLLQRQYIVSGWNGLLAADMLGLDPLDPDLLIDGHAYTKVPPIGSLLQLLYQSGPSGFVHFGGDYIFHGNGFSKDPVRFRYPIPEALAIGLINTGKGSAVSTSLPMTMVEAPNTQNPQASTGSTSAAAQPHRTREELAAAQVAKRSIFDRRLRLVSESYLGKLLLVDATQPGQLTTNKETGQREYEVVDALTTMAILDIKYLMGREKKIRIR